MDERDEDLAEEQEDLSLQLERFRPHLRNPIEVVISRVSESEVPKTEDVVRDLYKLSSRGLIKLQNPSPPSSFIGYLLSKYSLWFWNLGAFLILTTSSIYLLPQTYPFSFMRIYSGTIFSLYVPGYALIEALYPKYDDRAARMIRPQG